MTNQVAEEVPREERVATAMEEYVRELVAIAPPLGQQQRNLLVVSLRPTSRRTAGSTRP